MQSGTVVSYGFVGVKGTLSREKLLLMKMIKKGTVAVFTDGHGEERNVLASAINKPLKVQDVGHGREVITYYCTDDREADYLAEILERKAKHAG